MRDGSLQGDTSSTNERPPRRRSLHWGAALTASVLLTSVAIWQLAPREASSGVVTRTTTIELAANQRLDFSGGADPLAISPDGKRLAYVASEGGRLQLFVRELEAFDATPIGGTDDAQYPFYSPDGSEVAFIADGTLQRVPVAGGAAVPICDIPTIGRAGTWGSDGTIVFAADTGLMRVDAAGGTPTRVVSRNAEIDGQPHLYPRWLPNDRGIVSTVRFLPGFGSDAIAVLDLQTDEWQVVGAGV